MTRTVFQITKWVFFLFTATALSGCGSGQATAAAETSSQSQIANPASENCIQQGGTASIQKRGDGGEYGVCLFEDNRQCEEWALMRGDCPAGGIKVTGYVTEAARYCAITGGTYTITNTGNEDGHEKGDCTFANGNTCDADDYFNGTCDPEGGAASYNDPFLYCMAVGTIDAPDERYTGEKMPEILVQNMIDLELVTADAPREIQENAVWRCMDNSLWICHFGANIPCLEKADLSQTPTPEMEEYCKANPSAEIVPAAATGRATLYEWRCTDGKPEAGRQFLTIDSQGFISEFWHQLAAG